MKKSLKLMSSYLYILSLITLEVVDCIEMNCGEDM